MQLWMSGEIQLDVGDAFTTSRKSVERAVNALLISVDFRAKIAEWAYIAIILPWHHPDYPEVKKMRARDKSLEFRLDIDHGKFLNGSLADRQHLILDSLARSVAMMADLGVNEADRAALNSVLEQVKKSVPL